AAFDQFLAAVAPFAANDPETHAEVLWSALHGQATLNRTHRLRPTHRQPRAELLVTLLTRADRRPR
ncbi:MAG TPA: hypothetical protein VG497_21745, partial [Kribbella sp.]|nr:hypothetical protein [Kribbella sp.]